MSGPWNEVICLNNTCLSIELIDRPTHASLYFMLSYI